MVTLSVTCLAERVRDLIPGCCLQHLLSQQGAVA